MDLYKILIYISAILLVYYISENEVEGGKKRRRKHPVKPLFGVGIGYRKVVQYKPVLVFQKHKHYRPRYRHHHGWGGWGWGGWPVNHHGHSGGGYGHGGGGHGHGGGGHKGGHGHGGGHKGGHGHGGGHKGGHGHGGGHKGQHYRHGGWGWSHEQEGWGWGDEEYDDPYEYYGGWESSLKDNWSSGEKDTTTTDIKRDPYPGSNTSYDDTNINYNKNNNQQDYHIQQDKTKDESSREIQYSNTETVKVPQEIPPFPVNFNFNQDRDHQYQQNYNYNTHHNNQQQMTSRPNSNNYNNNYNNNNAIIKHPEIPPSFGFANSQRVRNTMQNPLDEVASASSNESPEIITPPSNFYSSPFPTFEDFQKSPIA